MARRQAPCTSLREVCVSALAALLTACSATPASSGSCEWRAARIQTCIRVQDLAEWDCVDDRTLLLWPDGAARAHLLRLSRPMTGLPLSDGIDILDNDLDRLICPCGRDAVLVAGPGGGVALISSIEYLSEQRIAELLGVRLPDP